MNYELLLNRAERNNLQVRELPLIGHSGRIKKNRICINKTLETSVEKACILAEELGHHYTTVGNILDQSDNYNRKQERQARLWAYNQMIGLHGLIKAFEHGCVECYDVAEYLEVTEEFLCNAIECYRAKYGISKTVGNYIIYFIPNLTVGKIV